MDKEGLDKRMPENEKEARDFVRSRAKNITELNFAVNSIIDISNLKYFENLETLNLSHNKNIKDFSCISGLHKLKNLNLSNTVISDFVEINLYDSYYKQSLKSLILSNTNFSCIENICKFTSLEILDLSENVIKDYTHISNLITLKKLYLKKMVDEIDFEPILGLNNLNELVIDENKSIDIDLLCKMKQLNKLSLLNSNLSIENEEKLKLALNNCEIKFRNIYAAY